MSLLSGWQMGSRYTPQQYSNEASYFAGGGQGPRLPDQPSAAVGAGADPSQSGAGARASGFSMPAAAGKTLGFLSDVTSIYGTYVQSREKAAMLNYNAKTALKDAFARADAIDADQKVFAETSRHNSAKLRVAQSAQGIRTDIGSPLLFASALARDQQMDLLEMQRQEDIERIRGLNEYSLLKTQAKNAKVAGNIAMLGQTFGAFGSIFA